MEQSHQPPYKLQKALIDQKIVPCINVRPYVFHDLMMTLPDFVKHFYPDLTIEKARQMLQDILKVVLYKGNRYGNIITRIIYSKQQCKKTTSRRFWGVAYFCCLSYRKTTSCVAYFYFLKSNFFSQIF